VALRTFIRSAGLGVLVGLAILAALVIVRAATG
jgi:hypothetical protein